jgi:hypothetical protein
VESAPSARLPQPRAAPRPSDDDVGDAEKNFAREWKQRPREDTAVNAGLEITEVKERKARRRRRGGRLVVVGVDGVAPPAPVEVAIVEHPALLGRDRAAALRFDDPTISLRHAELAWDDDDDDDDSPF